MKNKVTKKMVIELDLQTQALTKKDIRDWRQAWQMALDVDRPLRNRLLDIYRDVVVDGHLSGAMEQRESAVLQKTFKLVDFKTNKEDPELTNLFNSKWFKDLLKLSLQSITYGHSLIQLGDPIERNGHKIFDSVQLVPREHVVPELGLVTKEPGDELSNALQYRELPYCNWLIEVGGNNDLGLLLKAVPHVISKKNMAAFWDQFGELFGMPVRIAKTASRDPKEIAKMEGMMEDMGAAQWGLFPEGTELQIVETTRGDAYNVYDKRIIRANNELSKLWIGQTMTMDDGSSLSQSETHLEIFNRIVKRDADMVRDVINDKVIPLAVMHGILPKAMRFDWDESIDYTPEQQIQLEQMLLNNYNVDPKYFAEKYNIPITEKKEGKTNLSADVDFFV